MSPTYFLLYGQFSLDHTAVFYYRSHLDSVPAHEAEVEVVILGGHVADGLGSPFHFTLLVDVLL